MNYQEARVYIAECEKYGSVLGLANMRNMSERLGHPEDTLAIVHIAGTNGKGSVLACLSAVLKEAVGNVGSYSSPSVFAYLERIRIDGVSISEEDYARGMTEIRDVIDGMLQEGLPHPTPFEIETMLAFCYFARRKCRLVVLECGLGGELDATNIIRKPEVSVLTSISMDHRAYLGDTLGEIAKAKAGIIKKDCAVVTGWQKEEVTAVIREACRKTNARLILADEEKLEQIGDTWMCGQEQQPGETQTCGEVEHPVGLQEDVDMGGQRFRYKGKVYATPLYGAHQLQNAVLAIETLAVLAEKGYPISDETISRGLLQVRWPGRFEILQRNPYMIIDGAHNPDAAIRLRDALVRYFPGKRMVFIMGVFADKDYREILRIMSPLSEELYAIETPQNSRALPAGVLAEEAKPYFKHVQAMDDFGSAVRAACGSAHREDVIVLFGSLSFLGEAKKIVTDKGRESDPPRADLLRVERQL